MPYEWQLQLGGHCFKWQRLRDLPWTVHRRIEIYGLVGLLGGERVGLIFYNLEKLIKLLSWSMSIHIINFKFLLYSLYKQNHFIISRQFDRLDSITKFDQKNKHSCGFILYFRQNQNKERIFVSCTK